MRIRTVKPEMWSDEKIARLSEPSVILGIGLLNYADDEGYFNANEALIKAAIFPLREPSLSVQRMLSELADIGYIRLGLSEDGRRIGIVVRFLDHQKISHPQPSRLRHLVRFTAESLNVPTDVLESSVNVPGKPGNVPENLSLIREQGTGNREGKGTLPHGEASAESDAPRQALLTDAQRLGWLKRKRAWISAPSDEAAWLGMLKDFGPQAVDTAIEHLRRANPAKKYVDAGDVQSLIEAGRQSVAEPEATKPPELMSLVEGIAVEEDPDRKRELTKALEIINARGWNAVRDLLGWSQTPSRQRLESAILMNPAAASGLIELAAASGRGDA